MLYGALIGAIVGLLVIAIRRWTMPSAVFVITVVDGLPRLKAGKLTPVFLMELAEVLSRHGARTGTIRGVRRNGVVTLQFSKSIPTSCWQSIRNVWSYHAR